jgi:hypothetical protein
MNLIKNVPASSLNSGLRKEVNYDTIFYNVNYVENFLSRQFEILTFQLHHGNLNISLMKMVELNYSYFYLVSSYSHEQSEKLIFEIYFVDDGLLFEFGHHSDSISPIIT